MRVEIKDYGSYQNQSYDEVFIVNDDVTISFSNLGARINQWFIHEGTNYQPIVLSNKTAADAFRNYYTYYGTTVGRVGGRIAKGTFELNNKVFQLENNEGENHLHGGGSFDLRKWDYEIEEHSQSISVIFTLYDESGNHGYPGNLSCKIIHNYDMSNVWTITYQAKSDADTLFNPTNHVYFNLNNNRNLPITNHHFLINADSFLPLKPDGIPTGEIKSVEHTPFDFRESRLIEEALQIHHPQTELMNGYDHPWLFNDAEANIPQIVLSQEELNRSIEVYTDRPAVVIYSHNQDNHESGYGFQTGIAIETQVLPDAINHSDWGNTVLKAEELFESQTAYKLKSE